MRVIEFVALLWGPQYLETASIGVVSHIQVVQNPKP